MLRMDVWCALLLFYFLGLGGFDHITLTSSLPRKMGTLGGFAQCFKTNIPSFIPVSTTYVSVLTPVALYGIPYSFGQLVA